MKISDGKACGEKKTLFDFFVELKDPRIERNKRHDFMDIIAMAICAVIANANFDFPCYGLPFSRISRLS